MTKPLTILPEFEANLIRLNNLIVERLIKLERCRQADADVAIVEQEISGLKQKIHEQYKMLIKDP